MYSTQLSEAYEHECSYTTQFNGLVIDDIQEFFNNYKEELIQIFNLTNRNTQSIGIQYPDTTQFISEGNIVTLTEMGKYEYVGVIESINDPESYNRSMMLSEDDEFIVIDLLYKYDKSDITLPSHKTVEKNDVEVLYDKEPVEIVCGQFDTTVLNCEFDLDILCVVSDNYIACLVNDAPLNVSLQI